MKPTFETYGNYSSSNYGANALVFTDPKGNMFYYSYKTLIAFTHGGTLTIRKNDWGGTTGKHLNWINRDKTKRIDGEAFEAEYEKIFEAVAA